MTLKALKGGPVSSDRIVEFFDGECEQQVQQPDIGPDPFEPAVLPHPHGKVWD